MERVPILVPRIVFELFTYMMKFGKNCCLGTRTGMYVLGNIVDFDSIRASLKQHYKVTKKGLP